MFFFQEVKSRQEALSEQVVDKKVRQLKITFFRMFDLIQYLKKNIYSTL